MADKKISQLTAAAAINDADEVELAQSGASLRCAWSLIKTKLKAYFDAIYVTFSEPTADNSAGAVALRDSGVVGEAVAFPNLLYLKSDGKWWLADADAAATMPGFRLALESKNADETCSMLVAGRVRDDDWNWTVAGLIYASTTPGALTQTAPSGTGDQLQIVGIATSADTMIFAPSPDMAEIA